MMLASGTQGESITDSRSPNDGTSVDGGGGFFIFWIYANQPTQHKTYSKILENLRISYWKKIKNIKMETPPWMGGIPESVWAACGSTMRKLGKLLRLKLPQGHVVDLLVDLVPVAFAAISIVSSFHCNALGPLLKCDLAIASHSAN